MIPLPVCFFFLPHLRQQWGPCLVQSVPIEAFMPWSISFLTQGRFKNNQGFCSPFTLTLCYSLALTPILSFTPTPLPPPCLFSFSFTHSFCCFALVLFLAAPRIPPPSSPPPSQHHFTLSFLLLHVRHHSLLSASPLILSLCSPALCQRMSSTSINLSSSPAANNIFMIHDCVCDYSNFPT